MPRQDGARQLFGGGRRELQSACITGQAGAGAGHVGREVAGLQRRAAGRPAASPPVQPLSSLPPQARVGVAAPAAAEPASWPGPERQPLAAQPPRAAAAHCSPGPDGPPGRAWRGAQCEPHSGASGCEGDAQRGALLRS